MVGLLAGGDLKVGWASNIHYLSQKQSFGKCCICMYSWFMLAVWGLLGWKKKMKVVFFKSVRVRF